MVGNFFRHYCCPITGQTWTDEMTRMTSSSHTVYWTIWNHVEPEVFHIFLMENCHGKVYPKGQSNMVAMDRFFSHLNAHVWRIFPCHVRLPGDVYTVYQCMSSCPPTLGQATFTRGAQVDQEVAAQIKQVEARSWTTAVLNFEIGPEIGGTLVCGKLNGERWESYFKHL